MTHHRIVSTSPAGFCWRGFLSWGLFFAGFASAQASTPWRSVLYPETWQPPDESVSFYTDKIIQDFSYAGYRRGEEPIPAISGPIFDVTNYGADPTGATDSTSAIQSAINWASAAGGGVVFLPAGEFRVSPQGTNNFALRIASSNVVLRGAGRTETFLLNTSHEMRGKAVIQISPPSTSTGRTVSITEDLPGPTRRIPVTNSAAFAPGDFVRVFWSFTEEWIAEHNQQTWWNAGARPADARYHREVLATNPEQGWIEVDVPTRYAIKVRDNARVSVQNGFLHDIGVESLSIGNLQHPGTAWGENEYTDPAKPAYDVHASWLIRMSFIRDGWISGVDSFRPATNTSTAHMLSNGILLVNCFRVTVRDTQMRRAQYGGGGGNGYMFRLQHSNECLIKDSVADFSRHGFVISHAGTSGNVFLRVEDRETQRATGSTGSYNTGGSGSDHHMHFSHSNLIDQSHVHNSFFTAHHRRTSGTVPHGLTSAHGVFWNTSGSGSRGGAIVRSEQARYGYVIGTSGNRSAATNPTGGNTEPADHLEGIGSGGALEPASLYEDQLSRRVPSVIYLGNGATGGTVPVDPHSPYPPGATVTVLGPGDLQRTHFTFTGWNTEADGTGLNFEPGSTFEITVGTRLHAQWTYNMRVDAGPDQSVALTGDIQWTPAFMDTVAWYDAADGTTLTTGEGGVAQWSDKSGNQNHAKQETMANRPATGLVTIGGSPAVSFRASDQKFLSAEDHASLNLDSSGGANLFAVFNYHGFVAQDSGLNVALSKGQILFAQAAYGIRIGSADALGFKAGLELHLDAGTGFLGRDLLYSGTRDDATGSSQLHIDGGLLDTRVGATPIQSDNSSPLMIGRDPAGHRFADVDFGEILIVGGLLSGKERQRIEGYLAHKWGLAENLPADHPHRDAAPGNRAATADLGGSVSDAGGELVTHQWTLVSGPAPVQFADASALSTTATFTFAGDYLIRLTSKDEFGSASDEVMVTVFEVEPPHPFEIWAGGEAITFDGDANGDGIPDGLAWLLGAEHPSTDAASLLPTILANDGALQISFTMLNESARGTATLSLQHSPDLAAWTSVTIPEVSGIEAGVDFLITAEGNGSAVTATLPPIGPESAAKFFIRLLGQMN